MDSKQFSVLMQIIKIIEINSMQNKTITQTVSKIIDEFAPMLTEEQKLQIRVH